MSNTDFNFSVIKTLRNARGKTLEALSKDTGLSVRTISDIELNKAVPSVSSLMSLAASFGVSATDLYDIAQKTNPRFINGESITLRVSPGDEGSMIDLGNLILINKYYETETEIKLEKPGLYHYPCFELIYIYSGQLLAIIEDEEYIIKPTQSLYYASNLEHKFKFSSGTRVLIFYLPRDNQIAKELATSNQFFIFESVK